jgi:hypothetical protein
MGGRGWGTSELPCNEEGCDQPRHVYPTSADSKCLEHRLSYHRKYKSEHPRNQRHANIFWRYGVDEDWYLEKLAEQGGRCAICGTDDPGAGTVSFCIDHDHACCSGMRSCGRCLRGLLCNRCNRALGYFNDDPVVLQAAADYVK